MALVWMLLLRFDDYHDERLWPFAFDTIMKTAYELAMERLNKTAPTRKLTGTQKKAIGELESRHTAKIAQLEIGIKTEIAKAMEAGDAEAMEQAQARLTSERRKLQAELEEKKESIRQDKV